MGASQIEMGGETDVKMISALSVGCLEVIPPMSGKFVRVTAAVLNGDMRRADQQRSEKLGLATRDAVPSEDNELLLSDRPVEPTQV